MAQLGDIVKTESRCYPDVPDEFQGPIGDSLVGNVYLRPERSMGQFFETTNGV